MVKALALAFCFSSAVVSPGSGLAQFFDGNALLATCEQDLSRCTGYIVGTIDENFRNANVDWYIADLENPGSKLDDHLNYCLANGVTVRQLSDIVVTFLEGNPGKRHESAAWLVIGALKSEFPC